MLLNQCLAISLSPNNTGTSNRCDEPTATPTGAPSFWRRAQSHDKEKTKTRTAPVSINQASAFGSFKQLVEQNSLNCAQANKFNNNNNNNYKLNEVFKRVDFAGFVLPSWLLLSGTYDDLHCIKTHWASGQLRPPPGLRIETIGNIRSVNVDYFGGTNGSGDPTMAARGPQLPQAETATTTATKRQKPQELDGAELLKTIEWLMQESEQSTGGACEVSLERLAELINRRSASTAPVQFESIERCARALTQTGQLSMRHDPRSSSWLVSIATSGRNSVSSAKSKSTTLDSGLGGGGGGGGRSPSASGTSDELLEPGAQLAILERAPQSASSVLSRLEPRRSLATRPGRFAHQPADLSAEQVVEPASNKRRRGFSLTRSFSFRQHQQQQQQAQHQRREQETRTINEQRSAEWRWPTSAAETSRELDAAARHANANLPGLFRSKSMRAVAVSRGRGGTAATAQTSVAMTNHDCDKENNSEFEGSSSRFTRSRTRTSGAQANGQSHLRHLSQHHNHHAPRQPQATIDYLDDRSTHIKRSFSVRRNSLLGFGKRDELGGGGAGKIAMFLRKLFSIRTQGQNSCEGGAGDELGGRIPQPHAESNPTSGVRDNGGREQGRILVDIRHHHTAECPATSGLSKLTSAGGQYAGRASKATGGQQRDKARRRYHDFVASSPSFDERLGGGGGDDDEEGAALALSSPSQNSLIEILDCSRRLDRTRRDLRQEEARSSSGSRATWRLIKRSESSLSQQSNASCSTNKSTVSQQLRRHLDEAYKRHRKSSCSASKRERDFIDSINVLRQASRHASLENSRSSSKNRRHHHGAAGAGAAAGAGSKTSARVRTSEDGESQSSRLDSFTSPDVDWSLSPSSTSGGSARQKDDESVHDQHEDHLLAATLAATTDLTPSCLVGAHQPQASPSCACYYCCLSLVNNNNSNSPACCPPPLPLPACCLAMQRLAAPTKLQAAAAALDHHPHQNQLAFHNNQSTLDTHPHQLADGAPDLGCPIWRSMLMSYCQQQQQQHHGQSPFFLPPPHPFAGSLGLDTVAAAAQSQEIVRNLSSALANQQQQQQQHQSLARSPSSQQLAAAVHTTNQQQHQHQQQHNTTIDLKIEIGADFKKLAAAAAGQPARLLTRAANRRADQKPASGRRNSTSDDEDATATDSLDEQRPTSDSCSSSAGENSRASPQCNSAAKFIITSDSVKLRTATCEPTSDMTTSCDDDEEEEDDHQLSSGLHTDDSLGATNVNSRNHKPADDQSRPAQLRLSSQECRSVLAAMD